MDFDKILNEALAELEFMCGKRNHSKHMLPVLTHHGPPQVFYPTENTNQIKINESCMSELHRAYYQIVNLTI